ncbi:MAG TPA: acyl-ACP--UDP-N-acetylglucosamine O-acyltransferase [Xanthobacteraceae bacterium]|nr:acyl-ACP--UDP-N-acetylglucosamine O-acyltransferase [Xanthobacteraceae bacterium]
MTRIDASAHVAAGAAIGNDVSIGPGCVIGPHVAIGDGCRLIANVHLTGHTTIGAGSVIYPFVSLGTPPQSTRYRGGDTRLVIGEGCDLRESVTMNIGTEDGGGVTTVGDRGFFMANSHVAHDCVVGNDVTFANCATLGGHCVIGDRVVIGGMSAVHQFTRIGSFAMIGGMCGVRGDVIPYGLAVGNYAQLQGLNLVGMKRRNMPRERIHRLRQAYRQLFHGASPFAERVERVAKDFADDEAVMQIVTFIRAADHRPLCRAGGDQEE